MNLSDTQRQILLTLSDGDFPEIAINRKLGQGFGVEEIAVQTGIAVEDLRRHVRTLERQGNLRDVLGLPPLPKDAP